MRQREKQASQSAEETVRDIRRATRRHFSAEDKTRIVLEGLRGEDSIAELCGKEGIAQNLCSKTRWPRSPSRTACSKKRDRGWGGFRMRYSASREARDHQNRRDLAPAG